MKRLLQFLLPLAVLTATGLIVLYFYSNIKVPEKRAQVKAVTLIEVQDAQLKDFQVKIKTQGIVRPKVSSMLIPEVSGKIIKVSENFLNGKFFKKDEVLLEIDPRDFEISLSKAKSALIKANVELEVEKVRVKNFTVSLIKADHALKQALLTLKEEEARAEQARTDWEKLGRTESPSELVLRIPQLATAKAAVKSIEGLVLEATRNIELVDDLIRNAGAVITIAEEDVRQKELDLSRCKITAPFDGRIVNKTVDVGQYINRGNAIAEIYAIDVAEVRLPISSQQLKFLKLPNESPEKSVNKPKVLFTLSLGDENVSWQGELDRTESYVDDASRQQFVIAQVKNPFHGTYAFKPGLFVKAEIIGETLPAVYSIPEASLREGKYVWVVNDQSELEKREISVIWHDEQSILVKGNLQEGEKICITSLTYARPGLKVSFDNPEAVK
jgi:membrane fusion protein, multidrug efflux system